LTSFWHVTPAFQNTAAADIFPTIDAAFAVNGEFITASPINRVIKVKTKQKVFYVKTYSAGGKKLKRWFGRSRVRAEWENLFFFQALEIPIPPVVAYGQQVCCGVFQKGALITLEVPNTRDLADLHKNNHPLLNDRQWVEGVSKQVACYTRRIHQKRFSHVDLKWRNILVTMAEPPRVFFIDCPAGRIRKGPGLERWIVKDIACLDKVAKKCLSRTQRLRFYMAYGQLKCLDAEKKQHIRKILRFFKGRE
jgi:tRNA A-37 threonylcarbamoyl transferase component Bud32